MPMGAGDRRIPLRRLAQDLRIRITHDLLRSARFGWLRVERRYAGAGLGVGGWNKGLERLCATNSPRHHTKNPEKKTKDEKQTHGAET